MELATADGVRRTMFNTEIIRLLREKWANPTMLAEEIFAILQSLDGGTTDGPLTVNNNGATAGTQPGITVNNPAEDPSNTPILKSNTPGPDGGSFTIFGDGGSVFEPNNPLAPGTTEPEKKQPALAGIGQVVSGSGSSYQVQAFLEGPKGTQKAMISVTQLQIADDDTIPPGTWAMITRVKGKYYMQVPVWLDLPAPPSTD